MRCARRGAGTERVLLEALQEDRFDFQEGAHEPAHSLQGFQAVTENDFVPLLRICSRVMEMPNCRYSASHKSFPFCGSSRLKDERRPSRTTLSSLNVMPLLLDCQLFVTLQFEHFTSPERPFRLWLSRIVAP